MKQNKGCFFGSKTTYTFLNENSSCILDIRCTEGRHLGAVFDHGRFGWNCLLLIRKVFA